MISSDLLPLIQRPSWQQLEEHYQNIRNMHLRTLFAEDPQRGESFALEAAGIYLDYSKNRLTDETLRLLLELAESSGLRERIDAMFKGEKINVTERRAVLHVALRAPRDQSIIVDAENVVPEVHAVLDKMADFSNEGSQRRVDGVHRQAHASYCQHRHWRLRSRPIHGLRCLAILQ